MTSPHALFFSQGYSDAEGFSVVAAMVSRPAKRSMAGVVI